MVGNRLNNEKLSHTNQTHYLQEQYMILLDNSTVLIHILQVQVKTSSLHNWCSQHSSVLGYSSVLLCPIQ